MKTQLVASLLAVSAFAARAPGAEWTDDLAAALKHSAESRKPVLVLVRNPADIGSLDAGHWLKEDTSLEPVLSSFECVRVWNFDPALKAHPHAPRSGLYFLTAEGAVIGIEEIPVYRRELQGILAAVLAYPQSAEDLEQSILADLSRGVSAATVDALRFQRGVHVLRNLGRADAALPIAQTLERLQLAGSASAENAAERLEFTAKFHRGARAQELAGEFAAYQKGGKPEDRPKPKHMRGNFVAAARLAEGDDAFARLTADAQDAFEKAASNEAEALKTAQNLAGKLASELSALGQKLRAESDELRGKYFAAHPDSPAARLHAFFQGLEKMDRNPDAEKTVRTLLPLLLAQPMEPGEFARSAGYFTYAVMTLDLEPERNALAERTERELRVGRYAADVYLDQADCYFAKGAAERAAHFWTLAEEASADGESPAFLYAARAMSALVDPRTSPAHSKWAEREALSTVVLAPDFETYAQAIAQWTDTEFFPVLFQDDMYAPKFIAAFKPAEVLVLNPAKGAMQTPSVEAMRRIILASWTDARAKKDLPAQPSVYDLRAQLQKIGAAPLGVVFGDGESGEMAGALALAAGRFQPLEPLARPVVGTEGHIGSEEHYLSLKTGLDMAREIREDLRFWGLPAGDRWAYVTLAGKYPYRYIGELAMQHGHTYATEDLLGRDDDLLRIAVCGRLMGDYARSSYQAMCALFLQPESGFLFNTYGTNPKSEWGQYRMDSAEPLLAARMAVTHYHNEGATIDTFRAHIHPWNKDGLIFINSSGWPDRWSVAGGEGATDDFPLGAATVVNIAHSGSAAELYQPETIAHRAIWGGAYWYYGSVAEPFLDSFQTLSYVAPRIVQGVPLAAAFRRRMAQDRFYPWRLMLVGDPQFCLREKPAVRKPLAPELRAALTAGGEMSAQRPGGGAEPETPAAKLTAQKWANSLRFARWKNAASEISALLKQLPDAAQLDGADAAILIEEFLKSGGSEAAIGVWNKLSNEARQNYAVRVYSRYAAGALMDQAQAAKDLKALLAHFADSLSTQPGRNYVERWNNRAFALARDAKAEQLYLDWLVARAAEERLSAWRPFLRSEFLNHKERWTPDDKAVAVNAFAEVVKGQSDEDLLRAPFDALADSYMSKVPDATPAAFAAELKALFKADAPETQRIAGHVERFERDHRLHKDWLILGPFRDPKLGAWENVGPKPGQHAPDFNATFNDGKALAWTRPFKPGDCGVVDLRALLNPNQHVYAYAAADISADKELEGALLIGSDDGVTVWLDGKQIHRNAVIRGVTPDEDRVPLKLTAGAHSLVLRIDQETGGWGFCVRFVDSDGHDAPGVKLRCPERK